MQFPPSGVARQLVTFFCFAKKKVTKEKATPVHRPCGDPALLNQTGLLINSHDPLRVHVLKHPSSDYPVWPALLGGVQGREKQKPNSKKKPPNRSWAQSAQLRTKKNVGTRAHTKPLLTFFPLCAASKGRQTGGAFFGLPFLARQDK